MLNDTAWDELNIIQYNDIVNGSLTPQEAGTVMELTINVTIFDFDYNEIIYYMGLKAYDKNDQASKLSNIATFTNAKEPTTTTTSTTTIPTTTSTTITTTTPGEQCPIGWINGNDLGCLYFASESTSWLEASAFCEEINSDSTMVEIFTNEENELISLISNFELTITGVDGWWIGLDDIGHESIWQWQSSSVMANYFSWADDKPRNDSGNRNDCVYMMPKSSQANHFVWTDYYCDQQVNFLNSKDFLKQNYYVNILILE